ncbi:hypothetical protein CR513_41041, partial [Mucuna pruriens]
MRRSQIEERHKERTGNLTVGSIHLVIHIDHLDLDLENPCSMKNETFEHQHVFKEDTSLSHHLNEFQGILDQMSGMCIKFEDKILGLLFLNSLLDSWETFKVFITNPVPNGVVFLQMVKGNVLNEEIRRKTQGSSFQSKMGNDGVTKVIDVGDVCLQTNMGMQLWPRGVKHAPDIRFNLINVHMLDDGGYDNHFGYVYALKTKDQVLEKFKQFQALVERQSDNKKLVKSCDVQFMEDQTIEDIDKNGEQHNYVSDQQLGDCFNIPFDDDVKEEQKMSQDENPGDALEPPPIQLKRSNRERQ